MCLAVPGKIVEKSSEIALVDIMGNRMEVSTVLTPDAGVNDWVLVHAGFAIAEIDEAAARETWGYLQEMGSANAADKDARTEERDA